MAHMIMANDNLFLVRKPAWHGLGTIIQNAPNSEEAIKIAKLDWKVSPRQGAYIDAEGNMVIIPNQISNVREDTGEALGTVTENYKIIQNNEAFQFVDALLGEGAKFETAGSLENGRRVWMLARMPDWEIMGDNMEDYLLFSNKHDGKGAIHIAATKVRTVCANTINLALNTAKRSWTGKHMGNMEAKYQEASECLKMNKLYKNALVEEAEKLAEIKVSDDEFLKFCENLFPIKKETTERVKSNVMTLRNDLQTRYMKAPDLFQFRKTMWGVVNAVSDMAYHAEPLRRSITFQENRFAQVIDGSKLLDNAYELIQKTIKAN